VPDANIPLIVAPLVLLQVVLVVLALLDLRKQEKVKYLGKRLWAVFIVLVGIFGPLVYFMLGRAD